MSTRNPKHHPKAVITFGPQKKMKKCTPVHAGEGGHERLPIQRNGRSHDRLQIGQLWLRGQDGNKDFLAFTGCTTSGTFPLVNVLSPLFWKLV